VKAGVPLVNVSVNVSPETTADTIGLDGGSGTDHVAEACPEEVQVKLVVGVGDACAAGGVEAPQADSSTRPRVATTAPEEMCGMPVERRQLEVGYEGKRSIATCGWSTP